MWVQELVWVLWGLMRLVEEHRVWMHQAVVDLRVLEQWVAQRQAVQALVSVWGSDPAWERDLESVPDLATEPELVLGKY